MFRLSLACILILLLSAPALHVLPAQSQIRRCVMGDGTHLYTDRHCADIGATERLAHQGSYSTVGRPLRRDCSRRLQDLVFELNASIDSRDVNRLAGVYHWPGTGSRSGYAIMSRLDAIANRPLVDISPIYPPPPAPPEPPPESSPPQSVRLPSGVLVWPAPTRTQAAAPATADPAPDAPTASAHDTGAEVEPASTPRPAIGQDRHTRSRPTGLVVHQTAANRATPLQTVFSLRRHLGCWWVSL